MFRPFAIALLAVTAAASLPGVAVAQDQTAIQDLLKPGGQIFGNDGTVLGTVSAVKEDTVMLKTKVGPVAIPRGWVTLGSTGLFVDKGANDIAAMAKKQ